MRIRRKLIRLWRTFLLSGDRALLADLWANVQKSLAYAFETWDQDGDGLLEDQQHNTYDIEFYGPNPLTGVLLLGALRAATKIAERLGDAEAVSRYQSLEQRSATRLDVALWNGEYYRQVLNDPNAHPYQHGDGCLSDQLLGQLLAHVADLGHLLPEDRVRSAIAAVFRHNFLEPLGTYVNLQRAYLFADESGLLLCTWPKGGLPWLPFVYSDEVWTGVEYQVAAHLIYEGLVQEGLQLVTAARDRHDGYRRNPWNEVECGHHYARSMASWALLPALTGFRCDIDRRILRFIPTIDGECFRTLFICGAGWGVYALTRRDDGAIESQIDVLGGNLDGFVVQTKDRDWRIEGGRLAAERDSGKR